MNLLGYIRVALLFLFILKYTSLIEFEMLMKPAQHLMNKFKKK